MANKKLFLSPLAVLVIFGLFLIGCASVGQTPPPVPVQPGIGESVVIVQRKSTFIGGGVGMRVWLNGNEIASKIMSGGEMKMVIPDGEHSIQAGNNNVDQGNLVVFIVDGEEIIFFAEPQMGLLAARFKLTQSGKRKL